MNRLFNLASVIFCVFFVGVTSKASQDLASFPYLTKVSFYQNDSEMQACKKSAFLALNEISNHFQGQVLGGDWNVSIMMTDKTCSVQTLLISRAIVNRIEAERTLQNQQFTLEAFVINESATFEGLIASASVGNQFFNCDRRNQKNVLVTNWYTGSQELENGVDFLFKPDIQSKKNWLQSNFDCGPIDRLTGFELTFDVTNQETCPLSGETDRTCFIFRGIKTLKISFKE